MGKGVTVHKFGGETATPDFLRKSAEIIAQAARTSRPVVVISAKRGFTDSLDELCTEITKPHYSADAFLAQCSEELVLLSKGAIEKDSIARDVRTRINREMNDLRGFFTGAKLLGEPLTERTKDKIRVLGERLTAPLYLGALRARGQETSYFTGAEAGILTNDVFGNATALPQTLQNIRTTLGEALEISIPVVTGYDGKTRDGTITTLGRGSSDYTATLIAAALGASEVNLYKPTPGIQTADPGYFIKGGRHQPQTVDRLSYDEVLEIGRIIQWKAIRPAREANIPILVRSIKDPEIKSEIDKNGSSEKGVKMIVAEGPCYRFRVRDPKIAELPGQQREITAAIAAEEVNLTMTRDTFIGLGLLSDVYKPNDTRYHEAVKRAIDQLKEKYELVDSVPGCAKVRAIGNIGYDPEKAFIFARVMEQAAPTGILVGPYTERDEEGRGSYSLDAIVKHDFVPAVVRGLHLDLIAQRDSRAVMHKLLGE